jgi:hypothetical protein
MRNPAARNISLKREGRSARVLKERGESGVFFGRPFGTGAGETPALPSGGAHLTKVRVRAIHTVKVGSPFGTGNQTLSFGWWRSAN